ncbi:MAG: acetate--CoA ligase family protein [Spirochaetes bacterium]|nr:acetate--CoA ligase family protein [Spirochaetota bacterium]
MRLFEYQAKEAFREMGIPTPRGILIDKIDLLDSALKEIGLPCVIKSQVLRGGRGKAGLIQFVKSEEEAREKVKELLDSPHQVKKLLIEEAVNIEKEIYLSITVDPLSAKAMVIACSEGGVDIETLAVEAPEKIIKEKIDMNLGIMGYHSRNIVYQMNLAPEITKQVVQIIYQLYQVFTQYDAELAEINPLFITKDGKVIAGDGKLNIDDNMLAKHPQYERTREYFESDAEYEAALEGIPYLQFDGDISLMCAGAGLTTTVYDLINYAGGSVANYLEFGGPNYRKAVRAMELCLKNKAKVILIVTFGTIARADVMAEGIVEAIEKLKPDCPIVTCIRGTNEEEATRILKGAGLEPIFDTEIAVAKAVELTQKR